MQAVPFEACKAISSADVAARLGLTLTRKGSRLWACCPLHGEKTPSMLFDDRGRYHCFGCGADGDAVDLYAACTGVTTAEAARQLSGVEAVSLSPAQAQAIARRKAARELKQAAEAWYSAEYSRLCRIKHHAAATVAQREALHTPAVSERAGAFAARRASDPGACWEDETFCLALEALDAAELALCNLELSTPKQILEQAGLCPAPIFRSGTTAFLKVDAGATPARRL